MTVNSEYLENIYTIMINIIINIVQRMCIYRITYNLYSIILYNTVIDI